MVLARHLRLWRRRLRRRPLLAPLVLATVAADAALAPEIRSSANLDDPGWSAAYGFVMAQLGLVAVWLVGGGGWLAWRLLVAYGACAAFGWMIEGRSVVAEMTLFGAAWLATAALAATPPRWWIARRRPGLRRAKRRLTIASLIAWTTVGAILAAVGNAAEGGRWIDWGWVRATLSNPSSVAKIGIDALLVGVASGVALFSWRVLTAAFFLCGAAVKSFALHLLVVALGSGDIGAMAASQAAYVAAMTLTLGVWLLGLRVRRVTPGRAVPAPQRSPPTPEAPPPPRDDSPATLPMRIDLEG
ncbi:MAG: hypothetical protein AAF805_08320 [Planctomycetota bacterium]